jgi:hypothetical protein
MVDHTEREEWPVKDMEASKEMQFKPGKQKQGTRKCPITLVWVYCLVPLLLGDDIITQDSHGIPPCVCAAGWGFLMHRFPTQSHSQAGMHVVLHVKCPLLSDFNHNWAVTTNFSKTVQYQIS